MFEKITKDLTEAMKAKDTFRTSVLRMLKSALKNEEINKKSPLTDDEVLAIINSLTVPSLTGKFNASSNVVTSEFKIAFPISSIISVNSAFLLTKSVSEFTSNITALLAFV